LVALTVEFEASVDVDFELALEPELPPQAASRISAAAQSDAAAITGRRT